MPRAISCTTSAAAAAAAASPGGTGSTCIVCASSFPQWYSRPGRSTVRAMRLAGPLVHTVPHLLQQPTQPLQQPPLSTEADGGYSRRVAAHYLLHGYGGAAPLPPQPNGAESLAIIAQQQQTGLQQPQQPQPGHQQPPPQQQPSPSSLQPMMQDLAERAQSGGHEKEHLMTVHAQGRAGWGTAVAIFGTATAFHWAKPKNVDPDEVRFHLRTIDGAKKKRVKH